MAIIGILGAAAAPGVSRWIEDYRVRAASRQLMSDMQFARMKAVADNVQYQVYFNPANNQYWVQGWNPVTSVWNQIGATRQLSNAASPGLRARRHARFFDERRQDRHLFAHGPGDGRNYGESFIDQLPEER